MYTCTLTYGQQVANQGIIMKIELGLMDFVGVCVDLMLIILYFFFFFFFKSNSVFATFGFGRDTLRYCLQFGNRSFLGGGGVFNHKTS